VGIPRSTQWARKIQQIQDIIPRYVFWTCKKQSDSNTYTSHQKIVKFSWGGQPITNGFQQPNEATLYFYADCRIASTFSNYTTTTEIRRAFELDVDVHVAWGAGSFTGNTEYQTFKKEYESHSVVASDLFREKVMYDLGLNIDSLTTDSLSPGFVGALSRLPVTYSRDYLQFVEDFGTHIVTKVSMGAVTTYHSEFSTSDWNSLSLSRISGEAAVCVGFPKIGGCVNVSSSLTKEQIGLITSMTHSTFSNQLGSRVSLCFPLR
jgi:hypothetical protein